MQLVKKVLFVLLILAAPLTALGQATLIMSGQKVLDSNQQPLTGRLLFTVTDATDTPVTYTPQGGSPTTATLPIPTLKGAVQYINGFPATLPNPATMSPSNTRYRMQVQSSDGSVTYYTFPLVEMTAPQFSYDGYKVPFQVTATGQGRPQMPCNPAALYNDLSTPSVTYPYVCSQLSTDGTLVWTQNPSANPLCQKGTSQAFASPGGGQQPYCVPATNAFATPGFVYAAPVPPSTNAAGQIGLVPISGLCADGACGGGGSGNVLDALQTQIYIQPMSGIQAIAGPAAQTQNATTSILQGNVNSDKFQTGGGNNGLANLSTGFCATGHCAIQFPPNSPSTEVPAWYGSFYLNMPLADQTMVGDTRTGSNIESFVNPATPSASWSALPFSSKTLLIVNTKPYAYMFPGYEAINIRKFDMFGGINYFTSTGPFKSTYMGGIDSHSWYLTPGQHLGSNNEMNCWGMGDCIGPQVVIHALAGCGDQSDECTHAGGTAISVPGNVAVDVCTDGCTTGSTNVSFSGQPQTAQNWWIENWTAGKFHLNTFYGANCRIDFGESQAQPLAVLVPSGCTFPDSYVTLSVSNYNSSGLNVSVGNVNVPIQTSGLPGGYSANTSGYPGSPFTCGVADYASAPGDTVGPDYYEQTTCTVVNSTTLNMTLRKPHPHPILIAYGGMAGNDFTAGASSRDGDIANVPTGSLAQSMHIVYSLSNNLWFGDYAHTVNVADRFGFANESQVRFIQTTVNAVRTGGHVTVTLPAPNGLWNLTYPAMTGCSDATMNFARRTIQVTSSAPTTVIYDQAGADSTCTAGTLTYNESGFAIAPSAQIYTVLNSTTDLYDGKKMTLFPNNMSLAASDNIVFVRDAHQVVRGTAGFNTTGYINPKPNFTSQDDGGGDGCMIAEAAGPTTTCYTAVINVGPTYVYEGRGGMRGLPDAAYGAYFKAVPYQWVLHGQAGESGLFHIEKSYWENQKGSCDFRANDTVFNFADQNHLVWAPCSGFLNWDGNMAINASLNVSQFMWDGFGTYDFGGTPAAPNARLQNNGASGFKFFKTPASGSTFDYIEAQSAHLTSDGIFSWGINPTVPGNIKTILSQDSPGVVSVDVGPGIGNHQGTLWFQTAKLLDSSTGGFATLHAGPGTTTSPDYYFPAAHPGSTMILIMDSAGQMGYTPVAASGVASINTVTGAFTFTGAGVTCVSTTCTFTGGSGSPAGGTGSLQFNNSASFGGDTSTTDGAGNVAVTTFLATGSLPVGTHVNASAVDFFSGNGRMFSFGPNTTTKGGFQVLGVTSDVSSSIFYLDCNQTSGGCALSNGSTATTQSPGNNTTLVATTAFVAAAVAGGGGSCGSGATGFLMQWTGTSSCASSFVDYNITNTGIYTSTKNWLIPVVQTNDGTSVGGGWDWTEGTAPSGVASHDLIYADSTAHRLKMNNNNGGALNIAGVATAGTSAHLVIFAANGIDLIDGGAPPATSTTVNGQTCTLGSTCTVTAVPSGTAGGDLSGTYANPTVVKINGTAFSGTNGDLVGFGASSIPTDTGVVAANVVTQASNAAAGQICTYTGTNKICVPATALPSGVTATTQTAKDNSTKVATTAYVDRATPLTTGTSVTLTTPRQYFLCTSTCTITVPVPSAGSEFCVANDVGVTTAITLSAIGSSAQYGKTDQSAYGTAGTGTAVATAVIGNKICLLGKDSTHYNVASFVGTWTMN